MEKEIKDLLAITGNLKAKFNRSFPLDGRLVGDIGEVLVKRDFYVELHPENYDCYDAFEVGSNRQIQIKASMKYNFYYPYKHIPDYYMAVHINADSTLEVIYNGKGHLIKEYLIEHNIKAYNQTWYPLSVGVLRRLDKNVDYEDRIIKRDVFTIPVA